MVSRWPGLSGGASPSPRRRSRATAPSLSAPTPGHSRRRAGPAQFVGGRRLRWELFLRPFLLRFGRFRFLAPLFHRKFGGRLLRGGLLLRLRRLLGGLGLRWRLHVFLHEPDLGQGKDLAEV